mmetsp:Transcript_116698/g.371266  ORF Transcript_116698/g.371266 Transcript_116698/m.371266 type:complete len:253 (+) Transcript_116698:525-1283(+)
MPPRSGTSPMSTFFTFDVSLEPGPATRAVTARKITPRVTASALHSESGGASLMFRLQPAHMRESMSATFRRPLGTIAFSFTDMLWTVQSRRFKRMRRRTLYSSRSCCAASRTFISCISDHLPPFSAGASAASASVIRTAPLASAASVIFFSCSTSFSEALTCTSEAVAMSCTKPWAKGKLLELSTAEAMPSKLSAGLSPHSLTSSTGPAVASISKPRPACRRTAKRSDVTSASSAPRQKEFVAGLAKPVGKT